MIPVQPAPEPAVFDERVRRPGLAAIAELVGEVPARTRRGPKRNRLVAFQVTVGPAATGKVADKVSKTIDVLGLNMLECRRAREEYVKNYELGPGNKGIDLGYLERRAPFIAQELRRQGRLLRGDV